MPLSVPVLQQIEDARASRLLRVTRSKGDNLEIETSPPTKTAGMYWLFTSYTVEELKNCSVSGDIGVIPMNRMARLHEGLPHVSSIADEGFLLVYNGIAGTKLGLRGRIHQHFNGGVGTGCLSILKSTVQDLERWRVSYVTFGPLAGSEHDVQTEYSENAKDFERIWRLKHGWPLLCRT